MGSGIGPAPWPGSGSLGFWADERLDRTGNPNLREKGTKSIRSCKGDEFLTMTGGPWTRSWENEPKDSHTGNCRHVTLILCRCAGRCRIRYRDRRTVGEVLER